MMMENVVLNGPNGTIKASFDIYAFSAFQRYHNYCDRISSFCNRPFFVNLEKNTTLVPCQIYKKWSITKTTRHQCRVFFQNCSLCHSDLSFIDISAFQRYHNVLRSHQ